VEQEVVGLAVLTQAMAVQAVQAELLVLQDQLVLPVVMALAHQ
jgi:hypothetical protein